MLDDKNNTHDPSQDQNADDLQTEMPANQPHIAGEMDSSGGTAPHPGTDDDMDQMSERTIGNSPDEGEEIPNLADEINKDEEAIRES